MWEQMLNGGFNKNITDTRIRSTSFPEKVTPLDVQLLLAVGCVTCSLWNWFWLSEKVIMRLDCTHFECSD